MPEKNVVSWNSLITCYEQNGPAVEALVLFVRMMECGNEPDELPAFRLLEKEHKSMLRLSSLITFGMIWCRAMR